MLAERLYGKTIHVAAGMYNLNKSGNSPVSLSSSAAEGFDLEVLGGYPDSGRLFRDDLNSRRGKLTKIYFPFPDKFIIILRLLSFVFVHVSRRPYLAAANGILELEEL